jgi:general secretion pathway protein A
MYLSFYNLKAKPFQTTADQEFSWFCKYHADTLAAFKHRVHSENGIFLLFGEAGSGKNSFINCLLKKIDPNFISVKITDPNFECLDFFNLLAESFQIKNKFSSKGAFFVHFNFFLKNAYSANKRLIIIVDKAHRLKKDLLKELSFLSDIKINNRKMIKILLVGHESLNASIEQQGSEWITKKIAFRYRLKPLTEQETEEYIKHHLISAGLKRKIFTSGAVRQIYSFSKGNPILINNICDSALLNGYSNKAKEINTAIIKECSGEFQIREAAKNKKEKKKKTFWEKTRKPISHRNTKLVWKFSVATVLFFIIVLLVGYLSTNLESETTVSYLSEERETQKKHNKLMQKNNKISAEHLIKSDKTENKSPSGSKKNEVQIGQLNSLNFQEQKYIIHFNNDSNDLSSEAYGILDKIVSFVSRYPGSQIIIEGYTDSVGNYWRNIKLSKFRANIVKSYLVGKGIPQLKINVFGLGSKNPIESNKTEQGRMKNRRVQIKININDQI